MNIPLIFLYFYILRYLNNNIYYILRYLNNNIYYIKTSIYIYKNKNNYYSFLINQFIKIY